MKKHFNLIGNGKVMTCAALVGLSSVFGLSSCQQDDYVDEPTNTPSATQSTTQVSANDSVFVNNFKFDYDNCGTTSPDQYVADINFGPKHTVAQSRSITMGTVLAVAKGVATLCQAGNTIAKTFAEDPVAKQLETISMDLKEVKGMVEDLTEALQDNDAAKYYNEHMWQYYSFATNGDYLNQYFQFLREGDIESAYGIADSWAKQKLDCGDPSLAITKMMNYIPDFRTGGKMNIAQMYDYWVFQTTPWEHLGYQKREQLRLADITMCASGYILALAHYKHQYDIAEKADRKVDLAELGININALNGAFKKFIDFYSREDIATFPRHDDKLICQIKNANIVFNKDIKIRDMKNHPWQPNNTTKYDLKTLMYGDVNTSNQTVLDRSINQSEAEAIFNYYKALKKKDSDEKVTFEKIMEDAGFNLDGLDASKKHIMTLSDGCWMEKEHWYNRNFNCYFNHVVVANDKNEDPIRKNWKVGCMWIEFRKEHHAMQTETLKWWDHYSTDDCQYFYTNIEKRFTNMKPY
ncbi:MAG: hypothetical protein MJZ32_03555 [Bacteroidaceae bacterium]|nr:hypothetical protein [Bacteroidaceae bacterium]